jgi:hypothetical protein
MLTDDWVERIPTIFRVEYQPSEKATCNRWLLAKIKVIIGNVTREQGDNPAGKNEWDQIVLCATSVLPNPVLYSLFVRLQPDIVSLQLCSSKVVGA